LCGFGDGASGTPTKVDESLKLEIAKAIQDTPGLREIIEMAGRKVSSARKVHATKSAMMQTEVVGIEVGNDLQALLPTELVKLAEPEYEAMFMRGYLERSLMQYERSGVEKKEQGPVLVALDESSSMRGAKEAWSKGLAMGMLMIAMKQKRAFRLIHFAGSVTRVDDFPVGDSDPKKLLEMLSHFSGGGTSFETPLRAAHDAIKNDGLADADVMLITDGVCSTTEEFRRWWQYERESLGFCCYGVHIGAPGGVPAASLGSLCDETHGILDLTNDKAVTDSLFSI
jgi:uncharacterized protein with von Willebrand factor type A (vWA) domain